MTAVQRMLNVCMVNIAFGHQTCAEDLSPVDRGHWYPLAVSSCDASFPVKTNWIPSCC